MWKKRENDVLLRWGDVPLKKRGRPKKNESADMHVRYPAIEEEGIDDITEKI